MYSADVRKIATRLYSNYVSLRKVASMIGSSHSSIYRWLNHIPEQRKKQERKLETQQILDAMRLYIKTHPFCSVKDIQNILFETFDLKVSNELVRLTILKTLCYTKKKAKYFSEPKNYKEKLKEFLEKREKFVRENRVFVSINETSFGRNYLPSVGYSKKGKKLHVKRSFINITTCSALVAVSINDPVVFKIKKGSFDTTSFYEFLNSLQYPPKTVILMDNVSFHHSKKAKELIAEKEWDYLYTPPYSPIFNPIEGVFSIVKRHYSKYMNILDSFKAVTESHIKSFFRYSFAATTKY